MNDTMKQWLPRILLGGAAGAACYILAASFVGSFSLLGAAPVRVCFSMSTLSPKWAGTVLDYALWFAFGAEAGMATLPFDDRGWALAAKSLAHYAAMLLTGGLWACLELSDGHAGAFLRRELTGLVVPFTVLYGAVWGLRWVKWYFELASMRERLGLAGRGREDGKWR